LQVLYLCDTKYDSDYENGNDIFRLLNTIITNLIFLDFVLKVTIIRPLYFNRNYYGLEFIILDVLSGPISLILTILNYEQDVQSITTSDLFILFKIFTMERIRYINNKLKG
jgi:hypothetical protein